MNFPFFFLPLIFFNVLNIIWHVICHRELSMYIEKSVYSAAFKWSVLICLLGPFPLWCFSSSLFLYFYVVEGGVLKSPTINCIAVYFILHFSQYLLYMFMYSDIGCIYIWLLYLFGRLTLYHYIVTIFVVTYFLLFCLVFI